jgi:glutaredoxin-dependent peroxiredoxin
MSIEINQVAPDFTLFNTEKKEIKLSDYRGKNVVLLFFPFAFTSTCTAELCNMRDNLAYYNKLNAVIFGISIDSLFVLEKFKSEQKLTFDLLSDFNKEASSNYDALYETFPAFGYKGVSKRAVFVIDRDGKIRHTEYVGSPGDLPSFEAINQTLEKL